jgi:O-acetyl-ADP-ribose deacetylase (regulator of RNase III)
MVTEQTGNLITLAEQGEFDAIAHGCNCFCRMKRGIAPQIAKFCPGAEAADNETDAGNINKLGTFTNSVRTLSDGHKVYVFNLYTQFDWKGYKPLIHYHCFKESYLKMLYWLKQKFTYEKLPIKLGVPLIGCGLAGGSVAQVKSIFETFTPDYVHLTIVNYDGTISQNT